MKKARLHTSEILKEFFKPFEEMNNEECKKQLKEMIEILEDFFILKCKNSDLIIDRPDDKGWFYMDKKTADKLKRQIIKYKTR